MIGERDIMGGLAKGLAVIETFSADRPRQSISEVAAASGLDRATARRCLLTLAHHGYADYDGKFFTLTPRVLRLGTACLAAMPLPQIPLLVTLISLLCLAGLGAASAKTGGAPILPGTIRVTFWSAAAMAATALVGHLFGVAMQ